MATTTTTDPVDTRDAYLAQFKITASYQDLWRESEANPFARMVIKFVDDIVRADENLTQHGQQIIARIQRVTKAIATRHHINNLGELQRAPAEYDQACAARQTAIENLALAAAQYHEAQGKNSA